MTAPPPPPPDLMVVRTLQPQPDVTVVEVRGEVDITTSDRLMSILDDAVARQPKILVIDFGGVDFFGSSGISGLLRLRKKCDGTNIRLRVVTAKPVRRVLELVGLDDAFERAETWRDAIAD